MRVKIQQFLFGGTLFSWAIVGQNIGRALIKLGHDVEFVSTDKVQEKYIPPDLKKYVKAKPSGKYDMQVSYTAMHNFPHFLKNGSKNRFGIWNYDGTIVPAHMVKFHNFCDKLCPSSDFASEIFVKSGVPTEKISVVPHGINLDEFATDKKQPLKTDKSKKILLNIATPHKRKNLKKTLEAFGRAFTKDDDVCLVIKVNTKKQRDGRFFVNFPNELNRFKRKFKNHAEIEVVQGFIPELAELYNACDIVFQMSNLECWWLPGTEAFAAGKLVVASNHGGQLHYLNRDNSLLIDGKLARMPKGYQYWEPSVFGQMFEPDVDHAASQLRLAVESYDELITKFTSNIEETVQRFTWENVANQFLEMCE
jgi:glycosyltransferase involved in cell wall biosynthesis